MNVRARRSSRPRRRRRSRHRSSFISVFHRRLVAIITAGPNRESDKPRISRTEDPTDSLGSPIPTPTSNSLSCFSFTKHSTQQNFYPKIPNKSRRNKTFTRRNIRPRYICPTKDVMSFRTRRLLQAGEVPAFPASNRINEQDPPVSRLTIPCGTLSKFESRSQSLSPAHRRKNNMARITAILPASGHGTRMGADTPKQFLELDGTPIVIHSLRRIASCPLVTDIVVATRADVLDSLQATIRKENLAQSVRVVRGGDSRRDSVAQALREVPADTEIFSSTTPSAPSSPSNRSPASSKKPANARPPSSASPRWTP